MSINTNVNTMILTNQMAKNTALSQLSIEKLSKGLRITKAADDAAGLAVSEKMKAKIRGMQQANRNVQDGISMLQTAEGGVDEIGNIVQRMRELAVQASNETYSVDDRANISQELSQLKDEIDRIAESTKFNGIDLLRGSRGFLAKDLLPATQASGTDIYDLKITEDLYEVEKIRFITTLQPNDTVNVELRVITKDNKIDSQIINIDRDTVNNPQTLNFDKYGISFKVVGTRDTLRAFADVTLKDGLGVGTKQFGIQAGPDNEKTNSLIKISAMTTVALAIEDTDINEILNIDKNKGTEAANKLISKLDHALDCVNTNIARLGAQQNRLDYVSSNLNLSTENLSSAESRIRDVDVAKEVVKLSKLNILNQSTQAMVSQAKQQSESVYQLLR